MWVGYLFTDIEGSTERWERSPEHMQTAISRHDKLVEDVIASYGGEIQSRAGDGIFAVFLNGGALRCAIKLQLRLQEEDWSEVDGLWVRIGVHASPPAGAMIEDDIGALAGRVASNRASRIMACGWGGQTVTSHEAVTAFGVPEGSYLEDLGVCRLRGIDEPMRLFGLLDSQLKRLEFPPLHSVAAHSHTVPTLLTPLFGREDEVREVEALLEEGRSVTIVGPGGNGKTRLASEIARRVSSLRPVYFVLMGGVTNAAELVSQIAATLRFPFHGNAPRELQLAGFLRDKAPLLVLDNADTASAYPEVLDRLLMHCANLSILTTSRGALGFTGENLYPLHGLKFPRRANEKTLASPAFEFFAHEAKASNGSVQRDDQSIATLTEVFTLLSGSPLALRLAAHWNRLLSLEEILGRIRQGLDFLEAFNADRAEGPSTLRRVFEGSWSLLTHTQQVALARLSIIAGEFDAEAAAEVAMVDVAILGTLEQRGLISPSGRRRFQMHAIIREYSREKLGSMPEEMVAAASRHATYYLGIVRSGIAGPADADQGRVLDRLQSHIANVRIAWAHTLATGTREEILAVIEPLFYFLAMRSLFVEASELFSLPCDDELVRLYCRSLLSNCMFHLGDFDKADAMAVEVQNARHSSPLIEAHAMQALGTLGHVRSQPELSRNMYGKALQIRLTANDLMGSVYSIVALVALHLQRGELDDAKRRVREAFRLSRKVGNIPMMMSVTMFAGDIAMKEERLTDARGSYAESLRLEETVHNPQYRAGCLLRLGIADARLNDRESAAIHFAEALDLASDIGDRRLKSNVMVELGANLHAAGDELKALRLFIDAARLALEVGADPLALRSLLEIGKLELQRGNVAEARAVVPVLSSAGAESLGADYRAFAARFEGEGMPARLSSDWRDTANAILEDAEFGAWTA